ncbi:hypothetical protein H5S11_04070 [Limosilactobacillus sp. pH52_RY]|uniref:hypothetical protein n=1 Tax=Limosilactobacillus balticus TaxID=2759747 RepID=UPI0015F8DBBE|nr:hypothetical protein [Limosilactobacillus balticus]MBB1109648.1 hypothetical protein [Limosilactobacillus balticus]
MILLKMYHYKFALLFLWNEPHKTFMNSERIFTPQNIPDIILGNISKLREMVGMKKIQMRLNDIKQGKYENSLQNGNRYCLQQRL